MLSQGGQITHRRQGGPAGRLGLPPYQGDEADYHGLNQDLHKILITLSESRT